MTALERTGPRPPRRLSKASVEQFLAGLAQGLSVQGAADLAGVAKQRFYERRHTDEVFAQAWLDALESGTDVLVDEARRRAFEGWDEAVFQHGAQVGVVRRYSDKLLELLLRARRPAQYGTTAAQLTITQQRPIREPVVDPDFRPPTALDLVRYMQRLTAEGYGTFLPQSEQEWDELQASAPDFHALKSDLVVKAAEEARQIAAAEVAEFTAIEAGEGNELSSVDQTAETVDERVVGDGWPEWPT